VHDRVKAKRFEGIRVQFVAFEKKKEFTLALCDLERKERANDRKPGQCKFGETKFKRARDRENADFLRPTDRACTVPRDPPVTFLVSSRSVGRDARQRFNFRFRIFFFLSLLKEKEEKRESWRNLLINPKDMTRGAARQHGRHESQEKAKILRSQNRKHSQSAKLQEDGEHRARATTTGTVVVESQEPTNLNPHEEEDDDDVDDKAQQTGDPNTSKTLNNTEKEEEEEEEVVRKEEGDVAAARTKEEEEKNNTTSEEDGTKEENERVKEEEDEGEGVVGRKKMSEEEEGDGDGDGGKQGEEEKKESEQNEEEKKKGDAAEVKSKGEEEEKQKGVENKTPATISNTTNSGGEDITKAAAEAAQIAAAQATNQAAAARHAAQLGNPFLAMHNQQQQVLDPSSTQQQPLMEGANGEVPPMPNQHQNALLAKQMMQQQQQQQQNIEPNLGNSNITNDPAAAGLAQMMSGSNGNVQMAPQQQLAMAQMMQAMMAQQQMAALFHMQQQQQQHGGDQQQFNPMAAALNMGMVSPIPPAMFDNSGHGIPPEIAYQLMMQQQLQQQQQHGMMGMYGGMGGFPVQQHQMGGQDFMNAHQYQAMLANQMNINNNSNSNTTNGKPAAVQSKPKVQYDDVDIMYRKRGRPLGSKNATTKDSFKNVPKGKRTKRVAKGNTTNGNGVVARGGVQKVANGRGKKATTGKKKNGKNNDNSIPNGDDLQEYYDVLTSLKNSITC